MKCEFQGFVFIKKHFSGLALKIKKWFYTHLIWHEGESASDGWALKCTMKSCRFTTTHINDSYDTKLNCKHLSLKNIDGVHEIIHPRKQEQQTCFTWRSCVVLSGWTCRSRNIRSQRRQLLIYYFVYLMGNVTAETPSPQNRWGNESLSSGDKLADSGSGVISNV